MTEYTKRRKKNNRNYFSHRKSMQMYSNGAKDNGKNSLFDHNDLLHQRKIKS